MVCGLPYYLTCTPTPAASLTPTGTPTPSRTPTPSPTATPNGFYYNMWTTYQPGNAKILVEWEVWNFTGVGVPITAYLAIEVQGRFYFWPTYGSFPEPFVDNLLFPPFLHLQRFPLMNFAIAPTSFEQTINWYAIILDSRSYVPLSPVVVTQNVIPAAP